MHQPNRSFIYVFSFIIFTTAVALGLIFWQQSRPINTPSERIPVSGDMPKNETIAKSDKVVASGGEKFKKSAVFGLIKSLEYATDGATLLITFDQALWLTDKEAETAARKELGCTSTEPPVECEQSSVLSNNYFISNPINKIYSYKITPETVIRLVTASESSSEIGFVSASEGELKSYFNDVFQDKYTELSVPFWIIEKNGVILEMEEQHLP